MWSRLTFALATLAASLAVWAWQPAAEATTCAPSPPPPVTGAALPVPLASPAAQETRIHWTRVPDRITFGDATSLEGQVVTDDGAVPDAAVDLYARTAADDRWAHVASTTSDSDTGVFTFGCLEPRRTTAYRVVHEATLLHHHTRDDHRVGVSRRMADDMSQVGPSRFVFRGTVSPRYAGAVTLQRRDCPSCPWREVARRRTGDRSTWQFGIDVSGLHGELRYRATIAEDDRFARSVSDRVWRVTVS